MPALEAILYRIDRKASHTTQSSHLKAMQVQGSQGRIKAWMAGFPGSAFCQAVAGCDVSSVDGTRPPLKLVLLTTPQVQTSKLKKNVISLNAQKNVISLNHQMPHCLLLQKEKAQQIKYVGQIPMTWHFLQPYFPRNANGDSFTLYYPWDSDSVSNLADDWKWEVLSVLHNCFNWGWKQLSELFKVGKVIKEAGAVPRDHSSPPTSERRQTSTTGTGV